MVGSCKVLSATALGSGEERDCFVVGGKKLAEHSKKDHPGSKNSEKSLIDSRYMYSVVCAAILASLATALFAYAWIPFVQVNNQTNHLTGLGNIGMALILYASLFCFIGKWGGAFRVGEDRRTAVIASIVLTVGTADALEVFFSMAITGEFRFFPVFVVRYSILFLVQGLILSLCSIPMSKLYRRKFPPLRILHVYGEYRNGLDLKINAISYRYRIVDAQHYAENDLLERIQEVDAVLIDDIPSHYKNAILKHCVEIEKRACFVPKLGDVIAKYAKEQNVVDTPLFLVRRFGIGIGMGILKRVFDVVSSFLALILLSPLLLAVAIAIKLEDGGPVLFRQERVTLGGRRFMILKFRSMIVDAEKDNRPHPAEEKDPRITRVGSVIRSTRIDELPQLVNVLLGDMSIVGPRPERWEHVEKYSKEIKEFDLRHKVRGGLTGYAQVYGRYNTTALDKLKMDMIYIMNQSFILDLQIIFETAKILFQKESTEGFSKERVDEMRKDIH